MTDELRVRIVVEQALAQGQELAREAGRGRGGGAADDGGESFRRDAAEIRKEVAERAEKSRIQQLGDYLGKKFSGQSGAAGVAATGGANFLLKSAKIAALGAAIDPGVSKAAGNVGTAGAILAGGAKIIEAYVPAIVSAVMEAMGVPPGNAEKLSDEIGGWISDKLNAAMAAFTATGDTLEIERAKVRLGGTSGLEQAGNTYAGFYEVNKQRGEIEARFNRDISRDLARQIAKLATGAHGG